MSSSSMELKVIESQNYVAMTMSCGSLKSVLKLEFLFQQLQSDYSKDSKKVVVHQLMVMACWDPAVASNDYVDVEANDLGDAANLSLDDLSGAEAEDDSEEDVDCHGVKVQGAMCDEVLLDDFLIVSK